MAAIEDGKGLFVEWNDPALDPEALYFFLAGKRSVRQFDDRPVSKEILQKMVELGEWTSTASNAQNWHATIVMSPEKKGILIQGVKKMQALLCKAMKSNTVRTFAKLVPLGKSYLRDPNFDDKMKLLEEQLRSNQDHVIYNAPVVVILSTTKTSAMGAVNCHLAGAAMMYALQARSIGSCCIGMAEEMLRRNSSIQEQVGVPPGDKVHLVFALGYSKVKYRRLPHRKEMPVKFV